MMSSNLPRANLYRRGNWNEFAETIGVPPVTTTQTRVPNGVNEYLSIDPDGPGGQSPVNLSHDANGNLTHDPTARNLGDGQGGVPDPSGQVYEYDEENRLTAVRRAYDNALLLSISYDAVGRRVASTDYLAAGDPCGGPPGGMGVSPVMTRHVYAGLETLEEHLCCSAGVPGCEPADFALAREFVWGDRFPQPVALITHGGTGGFGGPSVPAGESVYRYLHDVLGSVVALTHANGQVVERYTYDPYGKTVIEATDPATGRPLRDPRTGAPIGRLEASAFGNPFAWTGQRYDAGVRLYHFLFRGYSLHFGRWLQRDLAGYVDGMSLYGYVSASPLSWRDPLGLDRWYQGTGHTYIVIGPIDSVYYRAEFSAIGGGGDFMRALGAVLFAWNVGFPGEVIVTVVAPPDSPSDLSSDERTDLALVRMFLDNKWFWYHEAISQPGHLLNLYNGAC